MWMTSLDQRCCCRCQCSERRTASLTLLLHLLRWSARAASIPHSPLRMFTSRLRVLYPRKKSRGSKWKLRFCKPNWMNTAAKCRNSAPHFPSKSSRIFSFVSSALTQNLVFASSEEFLSVPSLRSSRTTNMLLGLRQRLQRTLTELKRDLKNIIKSSNSKQQDKVIELEFTKYETDSFESQIACIEKLVKHHMTAMAEHTAAQPYTKMDELFELQRALTELKRKLKKARGQSAPQHDEVHTVPSEPKSSESMDLLSMLTVLYHQSLDNFSELVAVHQKLQQELTAETTLIGKLKAELKELGASEHLTPQQRGQAHSEQSESQIKELEAEYERVSRENQRLREATATTCSAISDETEQCIKNSLQVRLDFFCLESIPFYFGALSRRKTESVAPISDQVRLYEVDRPPTREQPSALRRPFAYRAGLKELPRLAMPTTQTASATQQQHPHHQQQHQYSKSFSSA
eukprot:m.767527 g.767527  ORF g.767527 m.767527 type:complete len:461 (+) comp59071_c0_seq9:993-2375(+)